MDFYGRVITDQPEVLAQAIAETVSDHLPDPPASDAYAMVTVQNEELPGPLQPWVASVTIMRMARNNVRLWTVGQAGYIEADAKGIGAVIADKEADIPSYRPCDEYWLLIYASADSLASTMMPAKLATDQNYTAAFDRVYVLDSLDRVHSLKTS